jgi:iron(III) transport system ATP-binding protein
LVLGAENENGRYRVGSSIGELVVTSGAGLREGEAAVLSIRPEDIEFSEHRPDGLNVRECTVHAKIFLGEYLDFQVKVGERVLLARVHPSVRTPLGRVAYLQVRPEKCIAIQEH